MKIEVLELREYEAKTLRVNAHVRYWEDSVVNGVKDTEKGDNMPCKVEDSWCPVIDIESGIITNWEKGKTANVHYKVCDECTCTILDADGKQIVNYEGYVPNALCLRRYPNGVYIAMDIDTDGKIDGWLPYRVQRIADECTGLDESALSELKEGIA